MNAAPAPVPPRHDDVFLASPLKSSEIQDPTPFCKESEFSSNGICRKEPGNSTICVVCNVYLDLSTGLFHALPEKDSKDWTLGKSFAPGWDPANYFSPYDVYLSTVDKSFLKDKEIELRNITTMALPPLEVIL